eukprot:4913123-Amphidinium_carterae.1
MALVNHSGLSLRPKKRKSRTARGAYKSHHSGPAGVQKVRGVALRAPGLRSWSTQHDKPDVKEWGDLPVLPSDLKQVIYCFSSQSWLMIYLILGCRCLRALAS